MLCGFLSIPTQITLPLAQRVATEKHGWCMSPLRRIEYFHSCLVRAAHHVRDLSEFVTLACQQTQPVFLPLQLQLLQTFSWRCVLESWEAPCACMVAAMAKALHVL